MFIVRETYRSRNDFQAIFKCPLCGFEKEGWGYADGYFYGTVMPNACCPSCGLNEHRETPEACEKRMGRSFHLEF